MTARPDDPSRRDLDLFRGIPASVRQSPWRTAAWTGAGAAVVGAAVGVAVAVACWLPNAGASGPPMSAIRAGTLAFLAAQHGSVDLDGTRVGFVPLGMTAIVAVVIWRASSVLADVLERLGLTSRSDLAKAGMIQAGGYAATCAALALIARLGRTSAPPIPVAVGAFLLCGIVTAASLASTSTSRRWSVLSAPDYLRPGLRAATGAVCVYVGAGSLLVAVSLLAHAGQVSQLSRMVGGGVSGIPLLAIGVLCAPNAAIAAASLLAGPGFAVGTGTSVTAFSASRGTLPAFPLLGAIPSGQIPQVLAVILLAGTLLAAGWVTTRLARGPAAVDFGSLISRLAVAAAGAGMAMAVLGWLSGGALGPARLHAVGPSPWQLGIAVAGEIAVMSLLLIGASALRGWLSVHAVTLVMASRRTLVRAWPRRADGKHDKRVEDGSSEASDDDKDEAALAG
ncbi:MAG TPA: DUF6350 family protein [Micromonosporaceae bacterium]